MHYNTASTTQAKSPTSNSSQHRVNSTDEWEGAGRQIEWGQHPHLSDPLPHAQGLPSHMHPV